MSKQYREVFFDDFTGEELNREVWNVELHEPGWVNEELQEYVDSTENIYLKDSHLIIQPVKGPDGSITSGRISTMDKVVFTYGKFEVRAKVPKGNGYLPAFWLMTNDEEKYGQWPRCGEIDCMEVLGHKTDTVYGTIHYGIPHGQQQGEYTILEGADLSEDFHVYTCEWEIGKIAWYIDGIKYYETGDWYAQLDDDIKVAYPAPFNHPFYIILNLAIGGSWVGYPKETDLVDQPFVVDYVRVYQKIE